MKFIREQLGELVGKALAPVVQKISAARKARTFHPDGLVFRARVEALSDLGEKLSGSALVRCSGALWKRGPQLPDVLGVAVRFRSGHSTSPEVELGDQDLLFATIVSPLTMPLSALTTDVGDFSHNHFWAVSPFDVRHSGRVKFRLSPGFQTSHPGTREQRLREAVERGVAAFTLELRQTWTLGWQPIARIALEKELTIDQAALHFSAFNDGKGFEPRGFVHALRKAVYPASQEGRPAHA